jgi:hypothetical protein
MTSLAIYQSTYDALSYSTTTVDAADNWRNFDAKFGTRDVEEF